MLPRWLGRTLRVPLVPAAHHESEGGSALAFLSGPGASGSFAWQARFVDRQAQHPGRARTQAGAGQVLRQQFCGVYGVLPGTRVAPPTVVAPQPGSVRKTLLFW